MSSVNWYNDKAALGGISITPSDTDDLSRTIKAIYVGATGAIKVDTIAGDTLTFAAVPVGIFPIVCTRVYSTGTTASSLVGLY